MEDMISALAGGSYSSSVGISKSGRKLVWPTQGHRFNVVLVQTEDRLDVVTDVVAVECIIISWPPQLR
jgi:hypothetical protein